jgi:homoserine O-acetyltransferase
MKQARTDNSSSDMGVGFVETKIIKLELPPSGFRLEKGGILPEIHVAYETYGELSPSKDNVIFICHALSGDAHAAGYHKGSGISAREIFEDWKASSTEQYKATKGWWDAMIGPGRGIDTTYYYVVCANVLGGCKGTTGPNSINPKTGRPYGSAFPKITIGDMVEVHRLLLKQLGIERIACVLGGSFGGMQALEWAIRYPEMVERCICIASGVNLSPQALAFDIVAKHAITSDPDWQNGDYYGTGKKPDIGLSLARKLGHITYLSPEMMRIKFGREKVECSSAEGEETMFQVESYLNHQGKKFVERFDANSYLHITRAIDEYDLVEKFGSLEKAFQTLSSKVLVVALSADWLFPPEQSMELANGLLRAGKHVSYCELYAPHGHDAFLVDIEKLAEVIRAFLPWIKKDGNTKASTKNNVHKIHSGNGEALPEEYSIISKMITSKTKILDLGCGDGTLLTMLRKEKDITGMGVDIDINNVIRVIDKGHDIFQADVDKGLSMIPDGAYDCVILSETLHLVRNPEMVLREMMRVGREGIVTFPNAGKWQARINFMLHGRVPYSEIDNKNWYNSEVLHIFSLKDFLKFCRNEKIKVVEIHCIAKHWFNKLLVKIGLKNSGAERVVVKITR